ncbi:hypothetical protein [Ktedonobacter sp. SOSP1-85]|nr:hypothetical protein [Ktedonobacter sp. SOSP1-85]
MSALIERLQRALAADDLPEEDREKIDQLGSWVGITAHQPPKNQT